MRFFVDIILALAILGGAAFSRPIQVADETTMRVWSAPELTTTQCFAQHAAFASDCASLLTNPSTTADWTNVAPLEVSPVFKPFCSGSCCIFTDTPDMPIEDLVSAGSTLMGCLQPVNGLLNGVIKLKSGGSVCMADLTGTNSCF
ncbi:hypothetical protein MSAN_02053300 [Mycena sanguinolenta]|uniref:Uncharacterized protein n=1 Tax=Mycena sanguinolenta TaxID=230812 RepID=A0A8H6XHE9_9AGAR|nr:hypothetical protein MSAN_02053300 [Mycena sanguinolenta]